MLALEAAATLVVFVPAYEMAGLVAQAGLFRTVGVVVPVLVHPVAVPRLHAATSILLRGSPAVQAPNARISTFGDGPSASDVSILVGSSAIRLEPFVILA